MSTPSLSTCTFRARYDEFSSQVSCEQDSKFWFRLEAAEGRDNVTDFFLGAFDPGLGGDLLTMCYKKLGKIPQQRLVFGDILSSRLGDSAAVDAAKTRFEEYTKAMLAAYGRSIRASHIARRREKWDLVIDVSLVTP